MEQYLHDERLTDSTGRKSKQHIHELGVNYVRDLLDGVGFTIHDVQKDPNHYFQLFAELNNKSLLIAVRTACHPDTGGIYEATRKKLIEESRQFNAVPHFAGLSLTPAIGGDTQMDGRSNGCEYNVIFNGITVVR